MSYRSITQSLVAACALMLLVACSKVTSENYAKVQTGMTQAEVENILGKPNKTESANLGPLGTVH